MMLQRMLTTVGVAAALTFSMPHADAAQAKKGTRSTKHVTVASGATLPSDAPKEATGQCKDNTYTTAKSKQGACSGHGGIKMFATAQCKDDTYSFAKNTKGACSAHGGVKNAM
jgi:hypothetical protein